jgi:hypothetical protein
MLLHEEPPVLNLLPGLGLRNNPTTEDEGGPIDPARMLEEQWLARSRDAYRVSTEWFDQAIRPQVTKNLAHFKSRHAGDSKYQHVTYRSRSSFFRPKTRAMVRRTEAAFEVALFSTMDVLDVKPWNDADPQQQVHARVAQQIMQYRLEQTIPWYLVACGAAQDACNTGVAISHQFWRYTARTKRTIELVGSDEDGSLEAREVERKEVVRNEPAIELVPLENFRIDPASDWTDPINSSPYLIHSVPSYAGDLRRELEDRGDDPGIIEDYLWGCVENDHDSIRVARDGGRVNKYENRGAVPDYKTLWRRKHIHRLDGEDWYWETINDLILVREPEPLVDAFPHLALLDGQRPYAMGWFVNETHTAIKESTVALVEQMQGEINDVANLRLDAAKNAMFGRWKALRGRNVDTTTLRAGIPQSIISVDNMTDLQELKQADVSQSAFASEDRLNIDFDEVSGNFSLASVASNRNMNETVGGMNMLSADAGVVKEYEVRTLVETWVEPVMQQLHAMEAAYEDDALVLTRVATTAGVTAQQAQDSLSLPMRIRVNVGVNATSPEKRLGKLSLGLQTIAAVKPELMMSINAQEVVKEVFGTLGYADGSRFFSTQQNVDPEKQALQQQVAQLQQMLQGKQMEVQSRERIAKMQTDAKMSLTQLSLRVQWQIAMLTHAISTRRSQLEEVDRMLAAEDTEIRKGELRLQREALSHEINESNREVKRLMDEARTAKKGGASKPQGERQTDGPPKLAGEDKAGVIGRDDFGTVPFAQG